MRPQRSPHTTNKKRRRKKKETQQQKKEKQNKRRNKGEGKVNLSVCSNCFACFRGYWLLFFYFFLFFYIFYSFSILYFLYFLFFFNTASLLSSVVIHTLFSFSIPHFFLGLVPRSLFKSEIRFRLIYCLSKTENNPHICALLKSFNILFESFESQRLSVIMMLKSIQRQSNYSTSVNIPVKTMKETRLSISLFPLIFQS